MNASRRHNRPRCQSVGGTVAISIDNPTPGFQHRRNANGLHIVTNTSNRSGYGADVTEAMADLTVRALLGIW